MNSMQIRSSIWENENRDGILSEITAEGPYYTSYPTLGLWDQNHGHGTYVEAMKDLFLGNGAKTPVRNCVGTVSAILRFPTTDKEFSNLLIICCVKLTY